MRAEPHGARVTSPSSLGSGSRASRSSSRQSGTGARHDAADRQPPHARCAARARRGRGTRARRLAVELMRALIAPGWTVRTPPSRDAAAPATWRPAGRAGPRIDELARRSRAARRGRALMELRRIGFAFNPYNVEAHAVLERAHAWCQAHGVDAWDARAEDRGEIASACAEGTDLVCVLGGDGTFLRSASAIGGSGVPALGINLGRIGFLAKGETDDLERARTKSWPATSRSRSGFRIEGPSSIRTAPSWSGTVPERGGGGARPSRAHDPHRGRGLRSQLAPTSLTRWSSPPHRLDRVQLQRRRLDPGPAAAEHDHHPVCRLPLAAAQVVAGEDHVVRLTLREAPIRRSSASMGNGTSSWRRGTRSRCGPCPSRFGCWSPPARRPSTTCCAPRPACCRTDGPP